MAASRKVWAIGRLSKNVWVILEQSWETRTDGSEIPVWIRHGTKWFETQEHAAKFVSFGEGNMTTDTLVGGWVDFYKPTDFTRPSRVMAFVSPALEYLIQH